MISSLAEEDQLKAQKNSLSENKIIKKLIIIILCVVILGGIYFRFYEIIQNKFFYYDEGYYLNFNRRVLEAVENNRPYDLKNFFKALEVIFKGALNSNKLLWYFLLDLRVFFGGVKTWYVSRFISALFGSLTIVLLYVFAKRFYNSTLIGALSAAILAILPSHLYYSRLGLQEGLSTFFFLTGIYFYIFPKRIYFRSFFSAIFFSCCYFTNYRMIIIPFFILFYELYFYFLKSSSINFRKLIWTTLIFLLVIFSVGSLYNGVNTVTTFTWMSYQKYLSKGQFDFFNFLSYPYYLFRLESIIFGIFFFLNITFCFQKKWKKAFPFVFVCTAMFIFSFPQEKGVRYLCFLMPFMAMAVATFIDASINYIRTNELKIFKVQYFKVFFGVLIFLMFNIHVKKAIKIINFSSDYEYSMKWLLSENKNAKVISSQALVQVSYTEYDNMAEIPFYYRGLLFLQKYGFNYLIIDPQAYISYTLNKNRFSLRLLNYLDFIIANVPAEKTFRHFNQDMLERFVLEHNENLKQSLNFLKANKNGELGHLNIYDVRKCIFAIEFAGAKSKK